jgi:hypothetical protein
MNPVGKFGFVNKIRHDQKGWQNNQQDGRPTDDQKLDKYVFTLEPLFHYFFSFRIKRTEKL